MKTKKPRKPTKADYEREFRAEVLLEIRKAKGVMAIILFLGALFATLEFAYLMTVRTPLNGFVILFGFVAFVLATTVIGSMINKLTYEIKEEELELGWDY